jgi:hypothetical protein
MVTIMVLLNILTFACFSYKESITGSEACENYALPEGVKTLRLLGEQVSIKDVSIDAKNQSQVVSICHTFGPLNNHDMALDVLADIEELGREGNVHTDEQKVKYAYWVYLEPMPIEELEKAIQALEANGIKDYHRNVRNQLSLGIYKGMIHAKRRQLNIAALGFSPLMGPLYRTEKIYWIDVTDMHFRFHTDDAWESYVARYPDSQHESTRCDLINVSHQRTIDPMTPIT